ncbi:MAG TPA: hypothetical protein VGN05_09475 [Parvibaculum sp.]|jgi:hypothetical protein
MKIETIKQTYSYELFVCALFLIILPLLNFPMFFEIYRSLVFKTVPTDNYQGLIAYFAGDTPAGYMPQIHVLLRPLSVLPLVPLYEWMPVIPLKFLPPGTDVSFARSSAAIAAAAFAYVHLTSIVTFFYARSLGRSSTIGLVAGLLVIPMAHIARLHTLDSIVMLLVALIFALWRRPAPQIAVLLLSIFANEKVAIIVGAVYFFRAAAGAMRDRRLPKRETSVFFAAAICFAIYLGGAFLVRTYFGVALEQPQFAPSHYAANLFDSIGYVFSAKGAVQIGLPFGLMVFMFRCAMRVESGMDRIEMLSPAALLLVASLSDVKWNIGVVVFLAFVVPLPFFADWIVSGLLQRDRAASLDEETQRPMLT